MRALTFHGREPWLEADYPQPQAGPGEALIRVLVAGICNTDLEIVRGYAGHRGVLGHEFVGRVESCDLEEWVGRRVVGEINCSCGVCDLCKRGLLTHCRARTTLGIHQRDGALADYCTLPVGNLHAVPDVVSDVEAVFVEPVAAAVEILDQAHIRPTERVLVVGDGKLGLLVAQVLSLVGCDLTCVGHHERKLGLLRRMGIDGSLPDAVPEGMADVVVECTGRPEGFAQARRWLRPRGRLVLKSTYHGEVQADLTGLVVDEISLIGSRCGPFAPALRLLERGLVKVEPMIETAYGMDQALDAMERAAAPGALKVLVVMEENRV
jgi:alcohol dehydrogenase